MLFDGQRPVLEDSEKSENLIHREFLDDRSQVADDDRFHAHYTRFNPVDLTEPDIESGSENTCSLLE